MNNDGILDWGSSSEEKRSRQIQDMFLPIWPIELADKLYVCLEEKEKKN